MDYHIYIKLTNNCNLKCKHCYNEVMRNHFPMSKPTFDKVEEWLKNFYNKHKQDNINVSFHGGEPLLYPIDNILNFLKRFDKLKINWCVTTNLIYELTEKHIELFKQFLSIENKPFIQTSFDFGDLRFSNEKMIDLWKRNVTTLINNGIEVQPTVCLTNYVIQNIEPQEIFNIFKELNIHKFNIERITETGRASNKSLQIKPKNKDQDEYLFKMFLEYQQQKNFKIPLFEIVKQATNKILLGCRERKCMTKVITINPDGTLSACPNMCNKIYGNLSKIDFNKKQSLINFEKERNTNCYICEYYQYCNGDCCQLTWDETGCPGMKSIFKYLLN